MTNRDVFSEPAFHTSKKVEPLDESYCEEVVRHIHRRLLPAYLVAILCVVALYALYLWFLSSANILITDFDRSVIAIDLSGWGIVTGFTSVFLLIAPFCVGGALYGIARGWSEISALFLAGGLLYVRTKHD